MMGMRFPLVLLAAGTWTSWASCWTEQVWKRDELVLIPQIPYGHAINPVTGENETLLADLAFPPGSDPRKKRPAIICIHGGGWYEGTRSSGCGEQVRSYLVRRGFVLVSIEYRLTGNSENVSAYAPGELSYDSKLFFPARDAAHDGKAAVRWLRKHASKLHVDPDRIAAVGYSAGATTALYMGYVGNIGEGSGGHPDVSSSVSAVVSIAGAMQLKECDGTDDEGAPMLCRTSIEEKVSCVDGRARPAQPPLLLVHGSEDTTMPFYNSQALHRRAQATGLKSDFVVLDGAGHRASFLPEHGPRFVDFLYESMALKDAACPQRASKQEL